MPNKKLPIALNGQATLALVFLIGGIILVVGVSSAFVVTSFITSGYGFQSASRAAMVANAGIDDALIKLIRNKDFSSPTPYQLPVGEYSASVTVVQNYPAAGKVTITSTAAVRAHQRKVQAIAAVDAASGEVQLVSWEQLAW